MAAIDFAPPLGPSAQHLSDVADRQRKIGRLYENLKAYYDSSGRPPAAIVAATLPKRPCEGGISALSRTFISHEMADEQGHDDAISA